MEQKIANERFLALSRICLNNWHYITKRTLSFNDEINFFTGHSGSGKSTVIDAMQIVLYANTDGRGFFNKAAADDSDRSLIEYLRGMVNIGDNNEFSYLRNQNFSSTIVLELKRSDTGQCQCVGIVFDVETATNEISRRFFWHKGPMWDNGYRGGKRTMSIAETEEYLQTNYSREEYFLTSHNERFRRILYDSYLGGLDPEKFPLLFKRAIPFRMNIKLEDFVKEYICMEQDIHIEDMQESVMQYGRMRKKIEDTCAEIESLKQIKDRFQSYEEKELQIKKCSYFVQKLEILQLQSEVRTLADKVRLAGEDLEKQKQARGSVDEQIIELTRQSDELLRRIASTGYEDLKNQLKSLNELLEQLGKSEARWQQTTAALKRWEEEDITSNQTLWDIEEFENRTIDLETLERLRKSMESMRSDTEKQHQDASSAVRELKKLEKQTKDELEKLRSGSKAYPKYLENARSYIQRRLLEETGKSVDVHVLADLLDVKRDEWRGAVEGYLGNNKLNLVVAPKYAGTALEIYGELDKKEYYNVAVLDTEKASRNQPQVLKGALSEEVTVRESYLGPYMDLLLGKVIKCSTIDELRECRIGITSSCMLYHTFRLQHINPDSYTKFAYIGKDSIRRRIRLLEQELVSLGEKRKPLEETVRESLRILGLPWLSAEPQEYLDWLKDINSYKAKEREKKKLTQKLELLKEQNVDQLERDRQAVITLCDSKKRERDSLNVLIRDKEREIEDYRSKSIDSQSILTAKERELVRNTDYDNELAAYLSARDNVRYDREKDTYAARCSRLTEAREAAFQELLSVRAGYIRSYPNRNFPVNARDNAVYDRLLDALKCDNLEEYKQKATEQAKSAVEHFRDDFMYKIRSAIREALIRKDALNRIISRLDFGKDKYQFVIGRNKGPDGRFYDMFMDDSLDINPADLNYSYENQMDLFTIEHEKQYGDLMNELISIFIPPENATPEQMDEARRNMDKYSDYRTYLSFDMQQLIQNKDEVIKIRLSKMIKKNSGGEGQNPLYVALLASFAQAYRINVPSKVERSPTIRLVVLDEAFSKMDGEKVASCIELIRGLGFQAIISATNDKIQNYVENVDKTFVFANPNKKSISIQEFERERFAELMQDTESYIYTKK
ncbi:MULTISPECIES: SbcC/MukB-like Walker B domain-containing protein [unclassified Clostridium]|uniref:ATP-binding protein n=1 Tax=unclassified Clostridium TaxID=2614128 RepID=UPI0011073D85|nr:MULTISPECIES: SbcC/MukB-like Walker B domain-containing protein [unclassified Clostridium]